MNRCCFPLLVALTGCFTFNFVGGACRGDDGADEAGFVQLFDGKTTQGWRGYRMKSVPKTWSVQDGALVCKAHTGGGDDMVTAEQYGDFDLRFEWKIAPGGNSGVMYRADESQGAAYMTGPEYQVLDNTKHADGKEPKTSAASLYGLYAPQDAELKPVGEYNTARIVVKGNHVEHWLNGKKVVECELGSPDWKARIAASKFAAWKKFGTLPKGHIVLQDHRDQVWFRNIRIKKP